MKPLFIRILGWAVILLLCFDAGVEGHFLRGHVTALDLALAPLAYKLTNVAIGLYLAVWAVIQLFFREESELRDVPRYPRADAGHRWLG